MNAITLAEHKCESNRIIQPKKFRGSQSDSLSKRWLSAERLVRFIKTPGHLLNTLLQGLPESGLIIEEVLIKEDRVMVKYKAYNSMTEQSQEANQENEAFKISCLDILSLKNGKLIERFNPVYQVNVTSQAH